MMSRRCAVRRVECGEEIPHSRSNSRAAVSALTVGATGLEIFAEAYPIGLVHRWISPLDAADFDGDGVMIGLR